MSAINRRGQPPSAANLKHPPPSSPQRIACVRIPALPLQLLLQQHPEWRELPAVVVEAEKPEGRILWANARARKLRIRPGLSFATGLSLAAELRAGTISTTAVQRQVETLSELLLRFSPDVEPYQEVPGTFWLNAAGLMRLHPSLLDWAGEIRQALEPLTLWTRVAIGFSRFGSYAATTAFGDLVLFEQPEQEQQRIAQVPLARLDLPPRDLEALARLGVERIADLIALPAGGLRTRFGPHMHQLHQLARGEHNRPLTPYRPVAPILAHLDLDAPETDAHRLLFCCKRLLAGLLTSCADRSEAVTGLQVTLRREPRWRAGPSGSAVDLARLLRPAAPTLDETTLLDLLRLWLEGTDLGRGVTELTLEARTCRASQEQLRLFAARPRRDLAAAERTLARLRAELGEDAVVQARLHEAHLPEASFSWEPVRQLRAPAPPPTVPLQLVRKLHDRPIPLPPRLRLVPEGWMLGRHDHGAVLRLQGPYITSGGWWLREVDRAYHFAEMQHGQILWLYHDRRRQRWFIHGEVR